MTGGNMLVGHDDGDDDEDVGSTLGEFHVLGQHDLVADVADADCDQMSSSLRSLNNQP